MQKVQVKELQPGMYVEELDRPWLETPYLLEGIMINSDKDIEELLKYCKYVYVSTERSYINSFALKEAFTQKFSLTEEELKFFGNTVYHDLHEMQEELPAAVSAETIAEDLMKQIKMAILSSKGLEVPAAKELVSTLTDSMIRNPDAMILLRQLKTKQLDNYARAINVSAYLIAFGRHLCLPKDELIDLGMGGLLMDIGLLKNPTARRQEPDHVLAGQLLVEQHPHLSSRIHDILLQHHEREDGSGFPEGLLGNQLSTYGRMAAIVDSYELMRHGMDEVAPMAKDSLEAFGMLLDWSRRWLNGVLVQQFASCMGLFPPGSLVELNSGELGIVMSHSRAQRFMPCLMMICNENKQEYDPPWVLDLREDGKNTALRQIVRQLNYEEERINPEKYFL